ncbi:MAG TPA: methyl-accepting chemotaxis protein, partial [Afipia sp.]
ELALSIREIGEQVANSRNIATRAITESQETRQAVGQLSDSAQKIGEVVKLISTIAQQTNLLALNATIESARAGEAGRGFAVVANEVKALASQTAQATEDIENKVGEIQSLTAKTVSAIDSIGRVVGEMSEIAMVIASAVEEQSGATREIARNIQGVADGTSIASQNIAGVRQASTGTGTAAERMKVSSRELADQADTLDREVGRFIADVKVA